MSRPRLFGTPRYSPVIRSTSTIRGKCYRGTVNVLCNSSNSRVSEFVLVCSCVMVVLLIQVPVQGDGGDDNSLESAFGAGKGKHAGKQRRRHTNKYSSKSKAAEIDPWEEQVQKAEETLGEVEARARLELQELEERRVQRRIERGEVEYPDEEDIDPYDPSTFGYIEVTDKCVSLFHCLLAVPLVIMILFANPSAVTQQDSNVEIFVWYDTGCSVLLY